jgi:hypothetical protein
VAKAAQTYPEDDVSDIVWGAHGIAAVIGTDVARVYYLIRLGRLPIRRLGHRTIAASRRRLLEYAAGELPTA